MARLRLDDVLMRLDEDSDDDFDGYFEVDEPCWRGSSENEDESEKESSESDGDEPMSMDGGSSDSDEQMSVENSENERVGGGGSERECWRWGQ